MLARHARRAAGRRTRTRRTAVSHTWNEVRQTRSSRHPSVPKRRRPGCSTVGAEGLEPPDIFLVRATEPDAGERLRHETAGHTWSSNDGESPRTAADVGRVRGRGPTQLASIRRLLRRVNWLCPVPGSPSVMSDRDHDNLTSVHHVDGLVREATNRHAAHLQRAVGHVDQRTDAGRVRNRAHCGPHLCDELATQSGAALVVPNRTLLDLS